MNKEEKDFFENYKHRIYEIIEQEIQIERKDIIERKIESIIPFVLIIIFLIYNFIYALFGYKIEFKQDILFIELLKSIFTQLMVYVFTYVLTKLILIKHKYKKFSYIITHIISLFSSYLFFELFNIVILVNEISWCNIVFAVITTLLWVLIYVRDHKKRKQKLEQLARFDYKMILEFKKIIESKSNKGKEVIRFKPKKRKK